MTPDLGSIDKFIQLQKFSRACIALDPTMLELEGLAAFAACPEDRAAHLPWHSQVLLGELPCAVRNSALVNPLMLCVWRLADAMASFNPVPQGIIFPKP